MHGVESLPTRWLEELELRGVIDRVARDLHAALEGRVDERAYPIAPANRQASSEELPTRKCEWLGIIQREKYNDWVVQARDAIADAAKAYDWPAVFRLLKEHPDDVNGWRVGGTSWYTPLHQAARGGAPREVVERLVALGAWRTLKTAKSELPVDIARKHGHDHLLGVLQPSQVRKVDARALEEMQAHLHEVIRGRVMVLEGVLEALRLPELGPVTEYSRATFWFMVPGMYGGFKYWLEADGAQPKLVCESWCRVVDGSGERHEVTPEGARLVNEGFV
jgi:hypothetical protein